VAQPAVVVEVPTLVDDVGIGTAVAVLAEVGPPVSEVVPADETDEAV
jgi:hypothetical protein